MNLLSKCFLFILNNIASQGSILRINHLHCKDQSQPSKILTLVSSFFRPLKHSPASKRSNLVASSEDN